MTDTKSQLEAIRSYINEDLKLHRASTSTGALYQIDAGKMQAAYEQATCCEGCDGSGVRVDATPHYTVPPVGYVCVERCDTCEKFDTDLSAAKSLGWPDPRYVYDFHGHPDVYVVDNR